MLDRRQVTVSHYPLECVGWWGICSLNSSDSRQINNQSCVLIPRTRFNLSFSSKKRHYWSWRLSFTFPLSSKLDTRLIRGHLSLSSSSEAGTELGLSPMLCENVQIQRMHKCSTNTIDVCFQMSDFRWIRDWFHRIWHLLPIKDLIRCNLTMASVRWMAKVFQWWWEVLHSTSHDTSHINRDDHCEIVASRPQDRIHFCTHFWLSRAVQQHVKQNAGCLFTFGFDISPFNSITVAHVRLLFRWWHKGTPLPFPNEPLIVVRTKRANRCPLWSRGCTFQCCDVDRAEIKRFVRRRSASVPHRCQRTSPRLDWCNVTIELAMKKSVRGG
jgi:hypothetical protein